MKKIKFNRIVNFLGRNGLFKAAGIQASITVNPSAETTVWLEPIRQDEGIGRAILQMPVDHIPELVEYLNSVHRQHGGGELYVEVGQNYIAENGKVFFIQREHLSEAGVLAGWCDFIDIYWYKTGKAVGDNGKGYNLIKKIEPLGKIYVGKYYADRMGRQWEILSVDTITPNSPYPIAAKATGSTIVAYFNNLGYNELNAGTQLMYQVGE